MTTNSFLSDHIWLNRVNHEGPYRGMVLDFIEAYAKQLKHRLNKPKTFDDWSSNTVLLRAKLLHSLGLTSLPDRTPLKPRITGRIERGTYWIEKVIYEPYPGFSATAHFYIPRKKDLPAPAILYAPGHWMENGKLEPDIQMTCANLAQFGFAVLVYDPIGQGERLGSWRDHGHLAPLLVGLSQEGWMVWESIRAIDYMVSRSEVDPHRIGMTGASGGGLNTFYTSAIDDRIQVSIPVCFVTTFLAMMTAERDRNWEDGIDLCNQVPGVMAFAEMSDICGLFAPKPLCLIASKNDWMFPIQGTREVFSETFRIYQLMNAADHLHLVEVDSEHGYSREMRQAAYGWFLYWLMGVGGGDPLPEKECNLMSVPFPKALTYMFPPRKEDLPIIRSRMDYPVSSEGLCISQRNKPETGTAITNLTLSLAKELPPQIKAPESREEWQQSRSKLIRQVSEILGKFPKAESIKDWFYNQNQYKGVFFERIEFLSEPGINLPCYFISPARWDYHLPTVVYLDEFGKENGLTNGLIHGLIKANFAVFAIDVRGIGESMVSDFEAATNALMTDRPIFGQQVWDVLRAVDELWQRIFISIQVDKGRIGCIGRGTTGLLALYAAALDDRLKATIVCESPLSYQSLILDEPDFPASIFLFDVLSNFDLPQVVSLVAPRSIILLNPVDGNRDPLSPELCKKALRWPQLIYKTLDSQENLICQSLEMNQSVNEKIIEYFKIHL